MRRRKPKPNAVLDCPAQHTEDEIVGAYKSLLARRQTPHAGHGRPKLPRCPGCGKPIHPGEEHSC